MKLENILNAPFVLLQSGSEVYKQPMYYALAHFTKLLVPGSVRVKAVIPTANTAAVQHTAFLRPDNATVIILLNR